MREIYPMMIKDNIKKMCIDACYNIDPKILKKLKQSYDSESSVLGKEILKQIIDNDEIAAKDMIPMCQDTGIVVIFLEIGNDIHFNFDLETVINEGVREAYVQNYLRASVVKDPFDRINTKDNTPAIIHTKIVKGNKIKIKLSPKGAGSENMCALKMLTPSDGKTGVIDFVLETLKTAGGQPCPPLVLGIGIGGNFEKCALMAKEALARPIDEKPSAFEKEILDKANKLGIGPMGLKGDTTVLAVKINYYPCHIASLPVAICIGCHANRHKEVII